MSSHAHPHSGRNVVHLDLASQKLLVEPDDPIPEFYPPPRAVMVTPIYHDADAFGHNSPSASGGGGGYRGYRDGGRRYYDDEYDDYDRGRHSRHAAGRGHRGGSVSPGYRGRYSPDSAADDDWHDDGGDYDHGRGGGDDMRDRKRSRVPGTEPPPLPPPDISGYPGEPGSSGHGRTQGHGYGHGHGRSQSQSYGRYDRDDGRYRHSRRDDRGYRGRRGGGGYRDDGDYPPPSDDDSDDYYPSDRYPDDNSYYSYTGGGGRAGSGAGFKKRSRVPGTEPPPLPPPDISGYPGGGHGGGHVVAGVPGVHQGAGPAAGSGGGGGGHGQGYAGSQYPGSQQGHAYGSAYAGSQYGQSSQQHPYPDQHQHQHQDGRHKPGLIGRIFSNTPRTHNTSTGQYMASHRPGAVPGHPAPMRMAGSDSSGSPPPPHGRGDPNVGHGQAGGAMTVGGKKLSPITQAFLRIAAKKGYGEEIMRYINQLPPSPQFAWGRCNGGKKAVLIGINYVGMKDELKGCANDARNMRDFLVNMWHFNPANIVLITDEQAHSTQLRPTRREMFNAMAWLVHDAKPNDSLFFHYSGHGGQSKDASGREADGLDEVIYPLDYDDAGDIIDDELHSALVTPLGPGVRLTAVFDSCHSGGLLDLPYLHSAHGRLRSMRHVSQRAQKRGCADSADVLCIAACKSDETSADTHEGNVAVGAMSYALIQSMKANPDQTYEQLLANLRQILIPKYDQKAQMSGTHPLDLERKFIL